MTLSDTSVRERVKGTVYAQLRVEKRVALSILTEGWTDEELQNLLDGDPEAYDAVKSELASRALQDPDECEIDFTDMRIDGGKQVDLGD